MHIRAPIRLLPLLALVFAAACGGDDKDDDDNRDPVLAITAAPATVSLGQGASTTVAVSINRSNLADATTALSIAGAPTGVTATIDPASTTADTATVTLTATQDATVGDATLTITAVAAGLTSTATLALTVTLPAPITVSGTLTNAFGLGHGAAIVHVWGNGATAPVDTSTAADGTFSAANVRPPYDVVFVLASGRTRVYMGVTSSSVTFGDVNDGATIGSVVDVTGDLNPIVAGAKTVVFVNSATYGAQTTTAANATSYTLNVPTPAGATSMNVNITALSFSVDGAGRPTAYHSFATRATNIDLPDPGQQPLNLMGPISSRSVSVRARKADGAPVENIALGWTSDRVIPTIGSFSPSGETTSLLVPTDARIPVILQLTASSGKSAASVIQAIGATDTAFDIQLPNGLQTVAPNDGAINVTDAGSLSMDTIVGATYVFELSSTPQRLTVYSASPTVSLARLRQIGAGLVSTTPYTYAAFGVFGGPAEPFGTHRMLITQLARAQNAGFRVVQDFSFVTQ